MARQLLVEGWKTCNDLDWRVVEVDEPAVVGTWEVGPTHAGLKRQLRVLTGELERFLTLRQALASRRGHSRQERARAWRILVSMDGVGLALGVRRFAG
jgi:hypothetical protein